MDKACTSAKRVVDPGTLQVTRCVLRGESCVLSVAREGTAGQRVEGTRHIEKGNRVRVMEEEGIVIQSTLS